MIGSLPPPYHGSSIYFKNLIDSKIKDEFDISHLDISDHRNLDNLSKLDFTNVKIALKSLSNLRKRLKTYKPDLVYIPVASNFLPYLRDGLFIYVTSKFSNSKIAIHLHEGKYFRDEFFENSNPLVKSFIKKTLSKADTAIVLGESLKGVFEGLVKNIEVCENGITEDFFNPGKKFSETGKSGLKAGFIGNLFRSKGVLDVLNAAKITSEEGYNFEFIFAGLWSLKENLTKSEAEKIISENNLNHKIKFLGLVKGPEKKKFFEECDIIVFPSMNEGSPLVILEAMSAGLPVISTKNVGAIPDLVEDGQTGILVDKNNPRQISDALIKFACDKNLMIKFGNAGREKFSEKFRMENNISKIAAIFNNTLK